MSWLDKKEDCTRIQAESIRGAIGASNAGQLEPMPKSAMQIEIERLEFNVSNLQGVVDNLIQKLRPIIIDKPIGDNVKTPTIPHSLLSQVLESKNDLIAEAVERINLIIRGIDL